MSSLLQVEEELSEILGKLEPEIADAEPQIDRAAELNKKWKVKTGDLWRVGEHRILCGDCLSESDVKRAKGGNHIGVTVIDPPFEMNQLPHISDPCIVFGQAKHLRMIPDALWRFERVIDKVQQHRSATVQIGHRHAFIAQCGTVKKLPDSSETYPSIVTREDRPDHPHQKSLELLIEHLTVWTPDWMVAFDPFYGSGTTMVACENLGRKCCGIEISPDYCAVILQRMKDAFPSLKIELS